jgi:hypothetical protein
MPTNTRPRRCPTHRGRHHAGCKSCQHWSAWERRTRPTQPSRTPTNRAQTHIAGLRAAGMSYETIAARSGISNRQLWEITADIPKYIFATTEAAILGVQPDPTSARWIDATGTRRRLQALGWLGWPPSTLAAMLGTTPRAVQKLRAARRIHPRTAAKVRAVYRELVDQRGPSGPSATWARWQGWVGPVAWADIDDPAQRPLTDEPVTDEDGAAFDEEEVRRAVTVGATMKLRDVDRDEAFRRLWNAGAGRGIIRERLRLGPSVYNRLALRHNREQGAAA